MLHKTTPGAIPASSQQPFPKRYIQGKGDFNPDYRPTVHSDQVQTNTGCLPSVRVSRYGTLLSRDATTGVCLSSLWLTACTRSNRMDRTITHYWGMVSAVCVWISSGPYFGGALYLGHHERSGADREHGRLCPDVGGGGGKCWAQAPCGMISFSLLA